MLKLFIKKPFWAVGFAAAAIFAVTFVGCASESDPPAPAWAHAGQAAVFYAAGSENSAPVGLSLVQAVGSVLSYSRPASGAFTVKFFDTVTIGSDGNLKAGSEGDVYYYFEAANDYTEMESVSSAGCVIAGDDGLLVGSLVEGDRYLCIKADGYSAAGAAVVNGANFGTDTTVLYEVSVIALTGGAQTTQYCYVATDTTLTATGLAANTHAVKVVGKVGKAGTDFVSAGQDDHLTAAEAGGVSDGDVVYVEVLYGSASTPATSGYYKAVDDSGVKVAITNIKQYDIVKVGALVTATTHPGLVAAANASKLTDAEIGSAGHAATDVYYVKKLVTSSAVSGYYFGNGTDGVAVANLAADDVVQVTKQTGFAAAGTDKITGTGFTKDAVYAVEVITVSTNVGAVATKYYRAKSSTELTAVGLTNANFVKVGDKADVFLY